MIVSPERGTYKCFACDAGGDTIDFYARFYQVSMVDAAQALSDKNNLGLRFAKKKYFRELNFQPLTGDQRDYLLSRGIESSSIEEFQFGSFGGKIAFPINDANGNCVGHQSRTVGTENKSYFSNFPKSEILGFVDVARMMDSASVLVVESFLDCIQAYQEGLTCVTTFSRDMSPKQAALLDAYFQNIVLAFDNDAPGIEGTLKAYERIKKQNPVKSVRFAVFSGKDIGEHLYTNSTVESVDLVSWALGIGLDYTKVIKMISLTNSFIERRLNAIKLAEALGVAVGDVIHDVGLVGD